MRMRAMGLAGAAALLCAAGPDKVDMAARILPAPATPGEAVKPFVKVDHRSVAILHVRVIDGTGAAPLEDRTVLIAAGRIAAVGGAEVPLPHDVQAINGTGMTLMPGIVGMHDHQYYIARPNLDAAGHSEPPLMVPQMAFSSPRLYLAGGVTTLRTTGSVEPYTDLNMKAAIDRGELPGPHMDVTGPYLEGSGSPFLQMHPLKDAEDARRTVDFWADQGVTSFKAYMNITRAQLKAAIDAAHVRGIKVTGHLCSVTYPEAAALGIDNLEHGFWVNTSLDPGKQPDVCPESDGGPTLKAMTPGSDAAKELIAILVAHKVAVTSTLPVFETSSPNYRTLPPQQLALMSPEARADYFYVRTLQMNASPVRKAERAALWANELAMERAFVDAGGLLIAGPDPTGAGNVLPGFGDQRAIILLVEAGFTPLEAIRIGTLNGATYLGLDARIGSIAPGKDADLVLVRGDPSKQIGDIANVVTVFKDGVGYDPAALLASVSGRYGQY
ncbi:amidohydrolase family protein [Sphingomonas sp.]|uniref:amidohydrolase family protein n=1 Tax=Sphingomonas sp. TaxID=28214 RepID=UPI001B175C18|nr:amidohydrolase family protein [Sphingomonas sp.]MBO9711942.1 amidohydrolase family protein [Sphingomonas sp.]